MNITMEICTVPVVIPQLNVLSTPTQPLHQVFLLQVPPNLTVVGDTGTIIHVPTQSEPENATTKPVKSVDYETITTYRCKLCSFTTENEDAMGEHMASGKHDAGNDNDDQIKMSVEQLVYMCGVCRRAFSSYEEIEEHTKVSHPKGASSVGSSEQNKRLLQDHEMAVWTKKVVTSKTKNKQNRREFRCPIAGCFTRLSNKEYVKKHEKCHSKNSPKLFSCPTCSENFNRWYSCATHLWTAHGDNCDLYCCEKCDYKTAYRAKCEDHKKLHEDAKAYKCQLCDASFKQPNQLRNHAVRHVKVAEHLPNWLKKKECDICGMTLSDGKALKKHKQVVHSKLKPYVCQVCGHCSAKKEMLQLHVRQHGGTKPYACRYCDYITGDRSAFRTHCLRHSDVKPYACPHCSYSARQTSQLKSHLSQIHSGLPGLYECDVCRFSTLSRKKFDDHKKREKWQMEEEQRNKVAESLDVDSSSEPLVTAKKNDRETSLNEDDDDYFSFFVPIDTGGITIAEDPSDLP